MKTKAILIAGAILLCAPSAYATTPIISGAYLITISDVCQAVINPYPAGTSFFDPGDYELNTGVAKFNVAMGKVTITGTEIGGSLIVSNASTGAIRQGNFAAKGLVYANTDTTLTLGNQGFTITYGAVKNGVAQQFSGAGIGQSNQSEPASNCAQSVTASKI